MWIDSDLKVRFSLGLHKGKPTAPDALGWLLSFEGRQLLVPPHFRPDPELLAQHAKLAVETCKRFQ